MKIHCLQHVPYEDEAYIAQWAREKGIHVSRTKLFEKEKFPDLDDFDNLLIMGGPMSIHDEEEYPWLIQEKRFIEDCIGKNKIITGICLGAQLIADVLGAQVYKNKYKEIGWFPVKKTDNSMVGILGGVFPEELLAFHWHGDTFNLPAGAVHIAESEACKNQAFEYNDRIFGFQFHMESTIDSIENILGSVNGNLPVSRYIQSEDVIRENYKNIKLINKAMEHFLNRILLFHDSEK